LMMPTHTSDNTDPAHWQNPPVPESYWQAIRDHAPAYNPLITRTWSMGVIPELFRTWPGVHRSAHPVHSFAAVGKYAHELTRDHTLTNEFSDQSPVGRLYTLDGFVLLLGVSHENNTSLHLAEHRAHFPGKRWMRDGTAMLVNGERQWVWFERIDEVTDDFNIIGDTYEAERQIPRGQVVNAEVRFMKQRPLVDFAVEWMEKNRK
jgi:aminoglycoside 3-N-acetyltransferase